MLTSFRFSNLSYSQDNKQQRLIISNMTDFIQIQDVARNRKNEILRKYVIISRERYFYDMLTSDDLTTLLLSIENPNEIGTLLSVSTKSLAKLINTPEYKIFRIKKKKNGFREITAPTKELKICQRRLNFFLQSYYATIKPDEVFGFIINPNREIKSCNIVNNSLPHVAKKWVLNIDIKDFFPSISSKNVYELFSSKIFGMNRNTAIALTLLCTYEAKLPVGAPTSPVISNFICYELDAELSTFCKSNDISYTRYADDLTFSGNTPMNQHIYTSIEELIHKYGFTINKKKVRTKSIHSRQTVTGLVVNEKVNVDRRVIRKIRAMLHDLALNGKVEAAKKHFRVTEVDEDTVKLFLNKLNGLINFVGQIRGDVDSVYRKYKEMYSKISVWL